MEASQVDWAEARDLLLPISRQVQPGALRLKS